MSYDEGKYAPSGFTEFSKLAFEFAIIIPGFKSSGYQPCLFSPNCYSPLNLNTSPKQYIIFKINFTFETCINRKTETQNNKSLNFASYQLC